MNRVLSKVMTCTVAGAFGAMLFSGVTASGRVLAASSTVKASELVPDKENDIDFKMNDDDVITLELDKDLNIDALFADSNLVITGDHTLTCNESINVYGNLDIKSGANIVVNHPEYTPEDVFIVDGTITTAGNITVRSKNRGICAYDILEDDNEGDVTKDYDIIVTGGTIEVESYHNGLLAADNLVISGGEVKSNCDHECINGLKSVNVCGGTVNCYADDHEALKSGNGDIIITGGIIDAYAKKINAIYNENNIKISGGNIKATAGDLAVEGTAIQFLGGNLESTIDLDKIMDNIAASNGIDVADNMQIITPENGKVSKVASDFEITDADGNVCNKVVIREAE